MMHTQRCWTVPLPLWLLLALGLLLLGGCTQPGSVGQEEQIVNIETIRALTPTNTPTPEPTATATPTPTETAPPTPTLPPSPTPLPPTATPNPALADFSYCIQQAGRPDGGRFSARIADVRTETFPAFERVVLEFELSPDSAPLSALATCVTANTFVQNTGEPVAPGDYVLVVSMPEWLQDEAAASSVLSATIALTDTTVARSVNPLPVADTATAGAEIAIGLSEAVPYRLTIDDDESRLLIDVARSSPIEIGSNQLLTPLGSTPPEPDVPIFFLLEGDIWRVDETGTYSLTSTLEEETALTVSPDGQFIAFCRNQEPGGDLTQQRMAVAGSLWLMASDGGNPQEIASVGLNCADPSFSPDGLRVAFSVDETGMQPAQRSIWVVDVTGFYSPFGAEAGLTDTVTGTDTLTDTGTAGGDVLPGKTDQDPVQRIAGGGAWSRYGPQWVSDAVLVYAAAAADNRSTLFLVGIEDLQEIDIGAELVVGTRYGSLGRPHVSPMRRAIAVEAERIDAPGVDLVLLDSNGIEQDVISDGYWTRFMGWGTDGTLYYLTTDCASTLVQNYALFRRSPDGEERLLVTGRSLDAIGAAAATGEGLVYVSGQIPAAGVRGPANLDPQSAAELWLWNVEAEQREVIYTADRAITALVVGNASAGR
ncbi:MAG: hypothetical protein HC914_14780 [Chloroflexaceae bacterium]|nr:hypothetical protein [Chloroflexaceae bacterium]